MTPDNTNSPAAALALAPCSESSVRWILEGQYKADPRRWDPIGWPFESEEDARHEERHYREYWATMRTGWLEFRVVRVTTTREILPNIGHEPTAPRATENK